MKSFISVFLTAALILGMLSGMLVPACIVHAVASNGADVRFTVETLSVPDPLTAGDTFTLHVTADALAAVNSVQLRIGYDETQLRFVDAAFEGGLASFDLREIVTSPTAPMTDGGEFWATAASLANTCDIAQGEAVLSMTFEAVCGIDTHAAVTFLFGDATTDASVTQGVLLTCEGISGGVTVDASAATTTTTTTPIAADVCFTVETSYVFGSVAAGDTLTLNVTTSALAAVNSLQLRIGYDETQLRFVNAAFTGDLASFDLREIVTSPLTPMTDGGEFWATAMSMEGTCDLAQDEVVLTVTFEAVCDISDRADVTLLYSDATTHTSVMENRILLCDNIHGGFEIITAQPGDINRDGNIDLNDATRLFFYVNGVLELTEEEYPPADLVTDQSVDLNDATRLFFIVNGVINL